jgi:hypothetical protein
LFLFPLNFIFPKTYYEVVQDQPVLLSPTTTPQAIMPAYPYKWVFSYLMRVRTLGLASYIGIGNSASQSFRLTLVGATFGFNANAQEVMDLTKIWYVADNTGAVIELIATYMPIPYQNDVYLAENRDIGV